MFSFKKLNEESRMVALIRDPEGNVSKDFIYFNDLTRDLAGKDTNFKEEMKKYATLENGLYKLKEGFTFQAVPSAVTTKFPRSVNYYIASSNSGKSYNIAQYARAYSQLHPDNQIIYCSANPLENDTNYADIKDKIKEIDVMKLDSIIDFTQFKNALFIFDDCDAAFSASLQGLDERLTEEVVKDLSVTDRRKAKVMLDKKLSEACSHVNGSIKSLLYCGRKNNLSLCLVGHKLNDGVHQVMVVNEATSVTLFPYSLRQGSMLKFLKDKLDFSDNDIKLVSDIKFFQYDFLKISHKGKPWIMTNDRIGFLE